MTHILSDSYLQQFNSSKMPMHSESFSGTTNNNTNNNHHNHHHHSSFSNSTNKFTGLVDATPTTTNSSINIDNFTKRYATEDTIIEVLKNNNVKQQIDILDELVHRMQQTDGLIYFNRLDELLNCIRSILINSINNELQVACLKCVFNMLKSYEKVKIRKEITTIINQIDKNFLQIIMPSVIPSCASTKIQIRQYSIDIIYLYMKQTSTIQQLFSQFIRFGIDNADILISKGFIESLNSLLTDDFRYEDYIEIVKSLIKHLVETTLEKSCMKALKRIEILVREDVFNSYLNKLSPNIKNYYLNLKKQENPSSGGKRLSTTRKDEDDDDDEDVDDRHLERKSLDEDDEEDSNLKFNIISNKVLKKLFGEDELQRLQAIEKLESSIRSLEDISVIYPYYEDFIIFVGNFIDDNNYKVRVGALEVLNSFTRKLKSSIDNCYKVVCNCAKQVMSQTHQSKTIKQLIMSILLTAIDNMKNPNLIIDSLLDKIKDKSAKCREEIINVIIATLIKFGTSKFDLINIFRKIMPLLFDIKRNVRYVTLECVAVLYSKLKDKDRNLDLLFNLLDLEDHKVNMIRTVIEFRLNRDKYAILNTDMTIDYAIKLPSSTSLLTVSGNEPDIDWIISASTSAHSVHLSSARSVRSVNEFEQNILPQQQQTVYKRKPSAKRLPWDNVNDQYNSTNSINSQPTSLNLTSVPKVMRSREVAPLKAFPFEENLDLNNPSLTTFKASYPSTTSYQEKYLKRMQSNHYQFDKTKDLQDITNLSKTEKALSYDSLYNYDDDIYQKKKLLNPLLNSNNGGIMPSKPTIPRRNSGNRATPELIKTNENDTKYQTEDEKNIYKNDKLNIYNDSNRKYETMPTLRTSAKSRKQIDKIFNIDSNNNNKTFKNNEFLNTPRSPDHYSESGVFSFLSDDHSNEKNSEFQTRRNYGSSNDSDYSSNMIESPFNTKPKLLRSNSKPKIALNTTSSSTNNKNSNNIDSNIKQTHQQQQQQQYIPTISKQQNNVEIVGKKLISNNNNSILTTTTTITAANLAPPPFPTHQQQQPSMATPSSPSSTTDTIVNTNWKKKAAALRNLNETNPNPTANPIITNNDDDSMLDIVGKGLFYSNSGPGAVPANNNEITGQNINNNNYENEYLNNSNDNGNQQPGMPDEIDFPLSLSFQSRLRQKTQEKIEERLRKKSDKTKKTKQDQLKTISTTQLNSNPDNSMMFNNDLYSNSDNQFKTTDFGLSISGYLNNTSKQQPLYDYNDKPSTYTEIFAELKSNEYKNYNNIDDEIAVNSSYASNSMFPVLDQQGKQRMPINDVLTKKPPKFNSRAKSLQRNNNNKSPLTNAETANEPQQNKADLDPHGIYGPVKEEIIMQPFKNADSAFKDAMALLNQDEWEKKCHAMNIIKRLSLYHEDLVVSNMHPIVVALLQEVRNLRSQVSRFALSTFGELFTNQKKYLDIDLDIAIKSILQKNGESSDFIRSDVEKCLDKMIANVTPHKALAALINGGASHRNPLVRKTAAQFIFKTCEIMGPGKILSGIKDVTERVLITASSFVVDGPPDIRWYGRKIFHMLMSYDEFDRMVVKYLNEATRKNIKEILDSIRVKGPGDVPSESARLSRKSIRNGLTRDPISRSAGTSNPIAPFVNARFDPHTQEDIKDLATQMRNTDFRERIEAIEKFQIMCETETEMAVSNIVLLFDKFCQCLTDSNSKVNFKALNTMLQITPILGDNLSAVISNVVPLIAQNLASKNNEIQDLASNILDIFVEYLDGGILIQPFSNLAQHGNTRIRPQIINKLADLIPHVYSRKQKQLELHVLPTLWGLLNVVKGSSVSQGSGSLNASVARLVQSLYEQMGEQLIERASNNSHVPARNLELLRSLTTDATN